MIDTRDLSGFWVIVLILLAIAVTILTYGMALLIIIPIVMYANKNTQSKYRSWDE